MKNRSFKHLTFNDRLKIEAWEKAGISRRRMAELLGCHWRTIYNELARGRYEHLNTDYTTEPRYSPDKAEERYRRNLRAKGAELKIGNDHEYAQYLEYMVSVRKYSPGAVLGEIARKGLCFKTSISKTTFYRYIDDGVFLTLSNKDLPVKRNKTAHRYHKVRAARPTKGESIERRPPEVSARSTFGHWEMDCVVGKQAQNLSLRQK